MTDPIKQYLYLVVDRQSNYIISICSSPSIANAVSDGFLNSTVMVIYWPYLTFENKNLKKHGLDYQINFKLIRLATKPVNERSTEVNVAEPSAKTFMNLRYDLVEVIEPTEDWISMRRLANTRLYLITYLERAIERYMIKHQTFSQDSLFYPILHNELHKTNSSSFREYAEISGMSEKETISHLKNKLESMSIYVFRMKAFWEKYVDYINSIQSETDINDILRLIEVELLGGDREIDH